MQMSVVESQVGVVKGNRIDSIDNGKCVMACGPKYFQNAPNSLIQFKCKDVSSGHLSKKKAWIRELVKSLRKGEKKKTNNNNVFQNVPFSPKCCGTILVDAIQESA